MKTLFILTLLLTTQLITSKARRLQQNVKYLQEKKDMFAAMNAVRENPKSVIPDLENRLKYFKGNTLYMPGKMGMRTNEGPSVIKELISELNRTAPRKPMAWSNGLSKVCQDFSEWEGPQGKTGHNGPAPGESPWDRMNKVGKWGRTVAENLSYGSKDGKEAMLQLLIDDGTSSRGHRKNILKDNVGVVGVGIAPHRQYGFMTCTDFAGTFTSPYEKNPWVTCKNCKLPKDKPAPKPTPKPANDGGWGGNGGSSSGGDLPDWAKNMMGNGGSGGSSSSSSSSSTDANGCVTTITKKGSCTTTKKQCGGRWSSSTRCGGRRRQ